MCLAAIVSLRKARFGLVAAPLERVLRGAVVAYLEIDARLARAAVAARCC